MFSRRIAPEHCTRGSDSIGRQARFSLISRSACAGTRRPGVTVSVCAAAGGFTGDTGGRCRQVWPSALVLLLFVVSVDLIVEASGHGLGLIDRRVILLRQDLVQLGLLRILLVL